MTSKCHIRNTGFDYSKRCWYNKHARFAGFFPSTMSPNGNKAPGLSELRYSLLFCPRPTRPRRRHVAGKKQVRPCTQQRHCCLGATHKPHYPLHFVPLIYSSDHPSIHSFLSITCAKRLLPRFPIRVPHAAGRQSLPPDRPYYTNTKTKQHADTTRSAVSPSQTQLATLSATRTNSP